MLCVNGAWELIFFKTHPDGHEVPAQILEHSPSEHPWVDPQDVSQSSLQKPLVQVL